MLISLIINVFLSWFRCQFCPAPGNTDEVVLQRGGICPVFEVESKV